MQGEGFPDMRDSHQAPNVPELHVDGFSTVVPEGGNVRFWVRATDPPTPEADQSPAPKYVLAGTGQWLVRDAETGRLVPDMTLHGKDRFPK